MQSLVGRVREGLLQAVDLLSTEFGIYSWDFLPYEALLIITCRICCEASVKSGEQNGATPSMVLEICIHRAVSCRRQNFVSRDIELVSDFVGGRDGTAESFGVLPGRPTAVDASAFRSNNSTSRAFILALAAKRPRSLVTGAAIDTAQALSKYNKKEFHHIYPTAHLKREKTPGQHNPLANIWYASGVRQQ